MNRYTCQILLLVAISIGCSIASATPVGPVRAIACAPTASQTGATIIDQTVWITTDQGVHWSKEARIFENSAKPTGGPDYSDDFVDEFETMLDEQDSSDGIFPEEDAEPVVSHEISTGNDRAILLAVDDSGNWATAVDGLISLGVPGRGIRQRIRLASVRGVLFDTFGRLWITTGEALLIFETGSRDYRRLFLQQLPGAGAPVPGRSSKEILIPARGGLFKATFEQSNDRPSIRLLRSSSMAIAACAATNSVVYVISAGRIKEISAELKIRDRGLAPLQAKRLVVGRNNQIRIATRENNWFAKRMGIFGPLSASAVSVDALGRFWIGTGRGPVAPGAADKKVVNTRPDTVTLLPLLKGSHAKLDRDIGQPPYRKIPFQLLPQVNITVDWDQKVVQYRKLETVDNHGQLRSHFSIFVKLTWALNPIVPTAYFGRIKRRQGRHMQQQKQVKDLWLARHNAVSQQRGAAKLRETINQTVAVKRYEALIHSVSGEHSPEEKP